VPTIVLTVQSTLAVTFRYNSDRLKTLFVECLAALLNLHTLELDSVPSGIVREQFTTTLGERKLSVKALVLPPEEHLLLQYCPNVEDLTCSPTAPSEDFVESLVVGGVNRVTKLSVPCPVGVRYGEMSEDICPSRAYFVSQ